MHKVEEGKIIWQPSKERIESSVLTKYMRWLKEKKNLHFENYQQLWQWSVDQLEDFWETVWEFCEVKYKDPYKSVLNERKMPGAKWFEGATLNYAENIFSKSQGNKRAIYFKSENGTRKELTWAELEEKVASVASSLREMGIKKGDRVVAYMPNIPETVIAFLAAASIGAIWSSCSPDFGAKSVVDRFKQIEPSILFAIDGYQYNGKTFDRSDVLVELQRELPTLKHTIIVPYLNGKGVEAPLKNVHSWETVVSKKAELAFEPVPFDHPLWVLYSSGTTGMPKPIVQGHGGITIEHYKTKYLHQNLTKDDQVFWFTSTGWVMWNLLVGNLLAGASIVLYDGSPFYPDKNALWELAEEAEITFFGTSAPYIHTCLKEGLRPGETFDLSKMRALFATGAPLSGEGYKWVYDAVKDDIWLSSTSGGTDVCTGFVTSIPIMPVRIGEIQGKALGVHAEAFDEEGNRLVNKVGELVILKPMPSMPLYFWKDEGNKRYLESYFDTYPGVWKHGDWIKFDEKGSSIIYGRSDSTINRSGVRTGTSDIYRAVERMEEIIDSLAIDLEVLGRESSLLLFVVLKEGFQLNDELKGRIREEVKRSISPRFMPDDIFQVEQIPKTLNGKKLEVPIRKMLLGFDWNKVVNPDSMSNPESLQFFIDLAEQFKKKYKEQLF